MIEVKINNSLCTVAGLSAKQFKEVRQLMSYSETVRSRWHKGFKSTRKHLMDKRGEFPTGLLYVLQKYLSRYQIPTTWKDARVRPAARPGMFKFQEDVSYAYPEQVEAAEAALCEGRGIITAPTGLGKSLIIALTVEKLQVPTLIVVPTLSLKTQLRESLTKLFGADRVGGLGMACAVENVDALDPKKVLNGYGCVIIDEFHHSAAATYRTLNTVAWVNVYFRIGLTATAFRSKSEERLLLESVLSEVIYQTTYAAAVRKGYIVPMETYYVEVPPHKLKGKGEHWHAVYKECVVDNTALNELAATMAVNLYHAGVPTLVLVKEVSHGEKIKALIAAKGILVPFIKGENDDNKAMIGAFNALLHPVILGTEGVLGEGVDTKPCEYVLDVGGGKARTRFMQKAGRGFRRFDNPARGPKDSCKLILFKHSTHKWFKAHFEECLDILQEEYGAVPARINAAGS